MNAVAARVRILEKKFGTQAMQVDPLCGQIVDAARAAHDKLDRIVGRHSHSPAAAVRQAKSRGLIGGDLARQLTRLLRAADAVRHVTPFALTRILEHLDNQLPIEAHKVVWADLSRDDSDGSEHGCSFTDMQDWGAYALLDGMANDSCIHAAGGLLASTSCAAVEFDGCSLLNFMLARRSAASQMVAAARRSELQEEIVEPTDIERERQDALQFMTKEEQDVIVEPMDIELVISQVHCSRVLAREALAANNNNIVTAIIVLSDHPHVKAANEASQGRSAVMGQPDGKMIEGVSREPEVQSPVSMLDHTVSLRGLVSAPSLNGCLAFVFGFDKKSGRLKVKLHASGREILVKANNITFPAVCPSCSAEVTSGQCFACNG